MIEGHCTTPRDIERALVQDFSADRAQRDVRLGFKLQIEVQTLLDLDPTWQTLDVVSPEFIQRWHREFYQRLPESLWQLETMAVVPGAF